ncbi:zinc ribbon domain-containing protein [Ruminococcus sp. AM31-15AC]|uniref:zinc ribbon domain-containing protein n=1 Tax=Ruminococcus sp. AM31-15AC TaxID=2293202 RepID=UPI000E4F4D51|nr:zinc ribbon domain-containing protein [Ruminococcus sp. AM31-15AC]
MENCPKCGLPVADGAKFCAACGTRMPQKLIKSKVCSVCGNTLNAGAKFCNVCGTAVPQDETPADEPVVDERNPEMESIEVPELHFDDTPVQNQTIPPTTPDMPTMDSVYLPGKSLQSLFSLHSRQPRKLQWLQELWKYLRRQQLRKLRTLPHSLSSLKEFLHLRAISSLLSL